MTPPQYLDASPNSTSMQVPRVSIIMPAYNAARFIRAAIDSVLAQTYKNFELIVVDDCSPDDCAAICQSYSDTRLRLVSLTKNRGLAGARNAGIEVAKGEFIGFLDSDDIAVPERLALQVTYFDSHPNCILLGGGYRRMHEEGELLPGENLFPLPSSAIRPMLLLKNNFNVSTVTLRRSALPAGGFRSTFAEDYDFISRMTLTSSGELANLPVVLAHYRINPGSLSNTTRRAAVRDDLWEIQQPMLSRLGLQASAEEREAHQVISFASYDGIDFDHLQHVDLWLRKLLEANTRSKQYDDAAFRMALGDAWFRLCYACSGVGGRVIRQYLAGCAHGWRRDTVAEHLRFAAKALLRRAYAPQSRMKLGSK
jgi:glycosyltransferase involved in cell wall biosynthesis